MRRALLRSDVHVKLEMPMNDGRVILAFLVAPLIVPLGVVGSFVWSGYTGGFLPFIIIGSIYTGYIIVFMFGVPAYKILVLNGITSFLFVPPVGYGIGVLAWYLLSALISNSDGGPLAWYFFGPMGIAVGAVIWLIARPDLQPRRDVPNVESEARDLPPDAE